MKKVIDEYRGIVKKFSYHSDLSRSLDVEIYKKWLSIFQPGTYYYFTFNPKAGEFIEISPEIQDVLGYSAAEMNAALFMSLIHPDDVPYFLNFEHKIADFLLNIENDKFFKYKMRYDFRMKSKQGKYIRILHQMVVLSEEPGHHNLVMLGIHTDMTYLKSEGRPVFSILGFDGEPSYIDIQVEKVFVSSPIPISEREREVVHFLAQGLVSKQVAEKMGISPQTVSKHRANIMKKTAVSTTGELINLAIKNGWI